MQYRQHQVEQDYKPLEASKGGSVSREVARAHRARAWAFAARRWLIFPAVLGLLGALAGLAAGLAVQQSARALVRINIASADPNAVERAVTSAALELDSSQVYQAASPRAGVSAQDLRERTEIVTVDMSQLVSITVTAPSQAQAEREANAVANAAIEIGQRRTSAALNDVTEQTRRLIREQQLSNNGAERARVAGLGEALAGNQSDLTAGGGRVTVFESAVPSRNLPSAPVLAALGLTGGALLGLALSLLLGARRGTVQSAKDLRQLYPQAAILEADELDTMLKLESGSASTVFVAGVRQDVDHVQPLTDSVRDRLLAAGRDVQVLAKETPLKQASPNGRIHVVPTTLSDTVLRRIARDRHALLIVSVEPNRTRLEWLDTFAPTLGDRTYLVVNQSSALHWD